MDDLLGNVVLSGYDFACRIFIRGGNKHPYAT